MQYKNKAFMEVTGNETISQKNRQKVLFLLQHYSNTY